MRAGKILFSDRGMGDVSLEHGIFRAAGIASYN
jgi:hypothetical protein